MRRPRNRHASTTSRPSVTARGVIEIHRLRAALGQENAVETIRDRHLLIVATVDTAATVHIVRRHRTRIIDVGLGAVRLVLILTHTVTVIQITGAVLDHTRAVGLARVVIEGTIRTLGRTRGHTVHGHLVGRHHDIGRTAGIAAMTLHVGHHQTGVLIGCH